MSAAGRDPDELRFEAEYLRALLDDCQVLLDLVGVAARELVGPWPHLLDLTSRVSRPGDAERLASIATSLRASMEHVGQIQRRVIQAGETVGGRIQVLSRELGGDDGEAEE